MTFVIAEPCVGVKDGSCAAVCPVECIHTAPDADMFYIDPVECIDCGICIPEYPVDAIYSEDELPSHWDSFVRVNSEFFRGDEGGAGSRVPTRPHPPHLDDGAGVARRNRRNLSR